jgi:IS1 family transposase
MGYSRKKVAPRTESEDDGTWMWVSFAPESRLIIDFILGLRKQSVADELIKVTDAHLSDSKPLFITDGLKFYAEALLKRYGEWIEFPKTGKRGRPKKLALVPDKDLRYAQVINNKQGKRLQKVDKRIIFGQNIDQKEILTSLLERQNLTFRQDNNRVSRKTIGFSKKIKCLYNQMRLYCTHFNFCRGHMGLTKEMEDGTMEKSTHAKEYGITKSKWTLTKLLNYRCVKRPTN